MIKIGSPKPSRCCGRCDGHFDECVSDMICEDHNKQGCETCWPHPETPPDCICIMYYGKDKNCPHCNKLFEKETSMFKTCPFCGGKALGHQYGTGITVSCQKCFMSTSVLPPQKAIEKWNTRSIQNRSEQITLLEAYSEFLEKNGYLDTDWRTEEPFAIDEFLKNNS